MIGIYKITNKINNKVYIGQSWDIDKRWGGHINGQHNEHLSRAFKKYGKENFSFDIIIELNNGPFTQKYLDRFEILYINKYKSLNEGYNIREGGSRGKHSKESKKKMSEYWKGKRTGEDNYNFGKHFTEEHRNNISKSEKGKKVSKETREKQSKAKINKKLSPEHKEKVVQYLIHKTCKVKNIDTGEIFTSIKEANVAYPKCHDISSVCKGKRKSSGGYRWEYMEE